MKAQVNFKKIIFLLLAAIFIFLPLQLDSQIKTTVSQILSNPDSFHNKIVSVDGYVRNLNYKTSKKGNPYTTFYITEGEQSLTVFSFGYLNVKNGDEVTAIGTFYKVKYVGRYTFYNELDITNGKIIIK